MSLSTEKIDMLVQYYLRRK